MTKSPPASSRPIEHPRGSANRVCLARGKLGCVLTPRTFMSELMCGDQRQKQSDQRGEGAERQHGNGTRAVREIKQRKYGAGSEQALHGQPPCPGLQELVPTQYAVERRGTDPMLHHWSRTRRLYTRMSYTAIRPERCPARRSSRPWIGDTCVKWESGQIRGFRPRCRRC